MMTAVEWVWLVKHHSIIIAVYSELYHPMPVCGLLSSSRYTFKALGTGFYGLRCAKDFRKTILEVVMQAGDADRCVPTIIISYGTTLQLSAAIRDIYTCIAHATTHVHIYN